MDAALPAEHQRLRIEAFELLEHPPRLEARSADELVERGLDLGRGQAHLLEVVRR